MNRIVESQGHAKLSLFISFRKTKNWIRTHGGDVIEIILYFYFGKFLWSNKETIGKHKNCKFSRNSHVYISFVLICVVLIAVFLCFHFRRWNSLWNSEFTKKKGANPPNHDYLLHRVFLTGNNNINDFHFISSFIALSPVSCLLIHSTFDFLSCSLHSWMILIFSDLKCSSVETHNAVKRLRVVVCLIYTFFAFRWLGFRIFQFFAKGSVEVEVSFFIVELKFADCLVIGIF